MQKMNYRAFTLLELIIVFGIIGSIMIAAPPILQWLNSQGIGHAVNQVSCDLQQARMMAISHKKTCTVQFNAPGRNQYRNSITQKISDLSAYRGGVYFMEEGPDRNAMSTQISFNSRGMAVPAGDIYISNADNAKIYRLVILMPGGISQYRWYGDQWN